MAKTLIAIPRTFEMECPDCHETVPAPCGSLFWTEADIELSPRAIPCPGCGKTVTFPARLKKL